MAFDESLAGRIRETFPRKKGVEEKMFGGVRFQQLTDGIGRATRFIRALPAKEE
jgi:hypothetical protein